MYVAEIAVEASFYQFFKEIDIFPGTYEELFPYRNRKIIKKYVTQNSASYTQMSLNTLNGSIK